MEFFYAEGACSLASHIALEEAGLEFEAKRVDLFKGEQQKASFLSMNPKGRIPVLVTDRGILTENMAILLYADDQPKCEACAAGRPSVACAHAVI